MMSKAKILTVSSDPVLLRMLHKNLAWDGYEMANTRQTGEELRMVLGKELPDMVILDIMMPNLDGIEICLRIRQWSLVPIVMLSAWGVEEGKVRGLNLSADGYLTEPFGIDGVKERIQEAIQRNLAAMEIMPNIYPRVPLES